MTEEEVYSHPEFKIIKRILKKEFSWIKDLVLTHDPNKYSILIFLTAVIDPWELAEQEGFTIAPYISKDREIDTPCLSIFFKEKREDFVLGKIIKEVEEVPKKVHNTDALPKEFKMRDKSFDISYFRYQP
jgi:hypothetical protein